MSKLVIISRDKLNATDCVVPLVREYFYKSKIKSIFFVPYQSTIETLKKNKILYNSINETSKLKTLYIKIKFIKKFYSIYILILLFFYSIKKYKFIHFGYLDDFPYSLIQYFFPKNFYYMQSEPYYTSLGKKNAILYKRGLEYLYLKKKWNLIKYSESKNIIINYKNSYYQDHPNSKFKNFFLYERGRIKKSWIEYVKKYQNDIDIIKANNKIITYVLTTFEEIEGLKKKNTTLELLDQTLNILNSIKDITVIVKPHFYSSEKIVQKLINKYDNSKFVISHLHPTLLALNSHIWLCNLYSTTCADAANLNVPTIEYTDYDNNVLNSFGFESLGKEYINNFIDIKNNENPEYILKETILNYMKRNKNNLISYSSESNLVLKNIINK